MLVLAFEERNTCRRARVLDVRSLVAGACLLHFVRGGFDICFDPAALLAERLAEKRRLTLLCPRESSDNFCSSIAILQDDGVLISPERHFNRGDTSWLDVDLRIERAGNHGTKTLRWIHSVQHGLRTFGQA